MISKFPTYVGLAEGHPPVGRPQNDNVGIAEPPDKTMELLEYGQSNAFRPRVQCQSLGEAHRVRAIGPTSIPGLEMGLPFAKMSSYYLCFA